MEIMRRLFAEEEGQGLVEYVLIIAIVSLVGIATAAAFGTEIATFFTDLKTKLSTY
jgi:pilus assembly protein Flp/PilA